MQSIFVNESFGSRPDDLIYDIHTRTHTLWTKKSGKIWKTFWERSKEFHRANLMKEKWARLNKLDVQ